MIGHVARGQLDAPSTFTPNELRVVSEYNSNPFKKIKPLFPGFLVELLKLARAIVKGA